MNTYLNAINAPIDNNYGNLAQKYLTASGVQSTTNNQNNQSNQTTQNGQQAQNQNQEGR